MYRSDGYRVHTDDPMYEIVPYIMPKRFDASNFISVNIDLDNLHDYTKKCRQRGIAMSHMATIIAAYIRVVSQNPFLNRFAMNKRIYARNHMCVSFVTLTAGGGNTVNKVYFDLDDDILTVNDKINKVLAATSKNVDNSMDKLASKLLRIPGLLGIGVGLLKFLDKFFSMPFWAVDASPFHTSLFLTNLASIRSNAVNHHLYAFGTTGVFIAMGQPTKETFINSNGEAVDKKIIPLCITTDERIANGHYFAKCFHDLRRYLSNPEALEQKPEKVIYDPDIVNKHPKWRNKTEKAEMPRIMDEMF